MRRALLGVTCNGYSILNLDCEKGHIRTLAGGEVRCEACPAGKCAAPAPRRPPRPSPPRHRHRHRPPPPATAAAIAAACTSTATAT